MFISAATFPIAMSVGDAVAPSFDHPAIQISQRSNRRDPARIPLFRNFCESLGILEDG